MFARSTSTSARRRAWHERLQAARHWSWKQKLVFLLFLSLVFATIDALFFH